MTSGNVNNSDCPECRKNKACRQTENARWALITTRVQNASKDVQRAMQEPTNTKRVRQLRIVSAEIDAIADAIANGNFEE